MQPIIFKTTIDSQNNLDRTLIGSIKQYSANVYQVYFYLPSTWAGLTYTASIKRNDGTTTTALLVASSGSDDTGDYAYITLGTWATDYAGKLTIQLNASESVDNTTNTYTSGVCYLSVEQGVMPSDWTPSEVPNPYEAVLAYVNAQLATKVNQVYTINGKSFVANPNGMTFTLADFANDAGYVVDANYIHTDNNFTTALLNKLNGITAGGEPNIIDTIKVNGVALAVSDKAVNVIVPTTISAFTNDSGYLTSSNVSTLANSDMAFSISSTTGVLTLTWTNYAGTIQTTSIDLPTENIIDADNTHFDATTNVLHLAFVGGGSVNIPLGDLADLYYADENTLTLYLDIADNHYKFKIKDSWVAANIDTKLATNGDASNTTTAFTMAENRSNIATGESLSVSLGKINKYLNDLTTPAFSAIDSTPTANSSNLVSSGGVYTALETKQLVANMITSVRASGVATDTNYPTEKAVRDLYINGLFINTDTFISTDMTADASATNKVASCYATKTYLDMRLQQAGYGDMLMSVFATIDSAGGYVDKAITALSATSASQSSDSALLNAQTPTYYLTWSNFVGTPTTLAGYGITDATPTIVASLSVATGDWASDSTYADYGYKATISVSGITTSYSAQVNFSPTEVISGIFASFTSTGAGVVYVWASEVPSSAINVDIIATKVVS